MTITIPLALLVVIILSILFSIWMFKIFEPNNSYRDYGIGWSLFFFTSLIGTLFMLMTMFAGAYFKLWEL